MRENAVRKRLHAGQAVFGTWLSIGDGLCAEMMAAVGWDWLLIDMEHGPVPLVRAAEMVTAVRGGGGTPFVRPAWNESSEIQRVLDLGAYGIIVPVVNTVDDARAVVRDARFPPLGERSRGGVRGPLAFGTDGNTYRERANGEILVFVQIETDAAATNAAEIVAIAGIDGLFVGPNDLAASSGKRWPDVWDRDSDYMEMVASIPRICDAAGKTAGILARDPAMACQAVELGYRFVGIAADVTFMVSAASAALKSARGETAR
ncbi:MAG: 2-dehydro-3-deoxyglucarate aldolase [Candidatus Eremiobacteraeota bacterium]|nr:2-dehydro-3-deoxyglucarate aldolase [Candidatus Eremiobacteraeota bacterium]